MFLVTEGNGSAASDSSRLAAAGTRYVSRINPRPHRGALLSFPLLSFCLQTRVFSPADADLARKDASDPEPRSEESEPVEELDPWDLPELRDTGEKWSGEERSADEPRDAS